MRLIIRKSHNGYKMLNNEKVCIATIKYKHFVGATKYIVDDDGEIVFTTEVVESLEKTKENQKRYVVMREGRLYATASFGYEKNRQIDYLEVLPKEVNEMTIDSPYGRWHVVKLADYSVCITQENQTIARISSCFGTKEIKISLEKQLDVKFIAAVYGLIDYMMHEELCDFI